MRYILLVLLNLPVILLATTNLITKYKIKRIPKQKFKKQIILWIVILLVLLLSFPLYNTLLGRPALASNDLSAFDIVETTVIIFLIYTINNQRQKIEWNERQLRDLHQELSIKLSGTDGKS